MSRSGGRLAPSSEGWTEVGAHDWTSAVGIETSLVEALEPSERGADPLFAYVDLEALTDVLSPGLDRGASHVCFEYGDTEVKVCSDGSISTRPQRP